MASRKITDCHPILQAAWEFAEKRYEELYPNAPQPLLTATYRSNEEQNELFAIGRTKKGKKVTNAKAGESPHNVSPALAFDIAFMGIDKKLNWTIKQFENFADIIIAFEPRVEWGGNFESIPDAPHFQLKNWKSYLSKK